MPWIEVKPVDAKVVFIADWIRGAVSFTDLCAQHGISRKTGYKWIKRYKATGIEGLREQSRRPRAVPTKIPYTVKQEIISLRKRLPYRGPKKIAKLLSKKHPEWEIPSATSIYNILKAEDLVTHHRRKKRVAPSPGPFAPAAKPNELWTADFKGQFITGDGMCCYPLTVMDHATRYLLGCFIIPGPRYEDSRNAFEYLFRQYGMPGRIRTDNGVPFASTSIGGLSRLSVWWIQLGIIPERIEPGKPQQNGRHERMHRTLKLETLRPPAATVREQQQRFDAFCADYNQFRPHEAINMAAPATIYKDSELKFPEDVRDISYPGHFKVALVNQNGTIWLHNKYVYLGYLLRGQKLGLEEVAEGVWDIYFGPVRLAVYKERDSKKLWPVNKK